MIKKSSLPLSKKVTAYTLFSLLFALVSCGGDTTNSESFSSNPSSTENYYNEDNFISSANEVTTTKLVTYEGPKMMESSKKVSIKVNDQELFVYETRVNHERSFSWTTPETYTQAVLFDFEGKVHLDVTIQDTIISSAILRPQIYGIHPSFKEHTISFDLTSSGNYVLEYNDNSDEAIQIFANPLEEEKITEETSKTDPNLIYVGPGVYDAGAFPIKDDTTIYLAGGSYVYGQFSAEGVKNVTIKGRGIVSGAIYSRKSDGDYTIPVVMRKVSNLTIKDVAFFDPAGWTIHLWKCEDVLVDNVKIITARSNGDGISIQSCKNVEVKGGYVRTWDDSLVVKNSDLGSTSNINIHDVVVWSDLAQCMEVGYETYGPTMDGITFQDITVVHAMHKAVISLHNSDQAKITNVTYKNITVEDCQTLGDDRDDKENDFLIDFTIAYNADWTKSKEKRGIVDGINIENVKVYKMSSSVVARMRGEDDVSSIQNVKIKGLEIAGKQITSAKELGLMTNGYVKNVTFESLEKVLGSYIHLPYKLSLKNDAVTKNQKNNISQEGLIVPSFARIEGEASFIGVEASVSGKASSSHGAGSKTSTPGDDGTGDFLGDSSKADYAFDGDKNTLYVSGDWRNEENEFATLTFDFNEIINIGVIRIFGDQTNEYSYNYSLQVWAKKIKKDADGSATIATKYTRLMAGKEYKMSPVNNNYFDINIPTQDYGGIQLRFNRTESLLSPKRYIISEIEFYPPSLTFGKPIVDSTEHNDVYPVVNVVDGDATGTSYYESKSLPATIVIDLKDVYKLNKLVLSLPPILTWSARYQKIEISVSDSNVSYTDKKPDFTVVKEATDYLFDPQTGNRVVLEMNDVSCRFLKVVIFSNDASGGYGGQLSEISAYGVK